MIEITEAMNTRLFTIFLKTPFHVLEEMYRYSYLKNFKWTNEFNTKFNLMGTKLYTPPDLKRFANVMQPDRDNV